jgi:hypothetical protein
MKHFFDSIALAQGSFCCSQDYLDELLEQQEQEVFEKAGILTRIKTGGTITCPACGQHTVSPELRATTDEEAQYVAVCEERDVGTFDFSEQLQSVRLDFTKLAESIAAGLNIHKNVTEHITGQLYGLGNLNSTKGTVKVFLLLNERFNENKTLFEEASKSSPLIILSPFTPPISFIDSVATIPLLDVISVVKKNLKADDTLLNQASHRLFGRNYYEDGTLYVRGNPIVAGIKAGTKLDIFLSFLSSSSNINKAIGYDEILKHYNEKKQSNKIVGGSEQWCHQTLTDLRNKCKDEDKELVDIVIVKGGKKGAVNSLIFKNEA